MMHKNQKTYPIELSLRLIKNKWKILIIKELISGTKRFGELRKLIPGITHKMLTANLRELEAAGILTRRVYPEIPPKVEYTLTKVGYHLKIVIDALNEWGEEYQTTTIIS